MIFFYVLLPFILREYSISKVSWGLILHVLAAINRNNRKMSHGSSLVSVGRTIKQPRAQIRWLETYDR